MKYYFPALLCLLLFTGARAQEQKFFAFPLTDYSVDLNDSIRVVQVILPQNILLKEKQTGLVKSVYNSETRDSVKEIGSGKCHLIKNDYYYFSIKAINLKRKPAAGDLLYCMVTIPGVYEGSLFGITRHSIFLKDVYDSILTSLNEILKIKSAAEEQSFLKKLVEDIRFTGGAMLSQGTVANSTISGGRFDGQKILNAMQTVTEKDLSDFLKYMGARPSLYAGHAWKISEIMATWMVSETPAITGN